MKEKTPKSLRLHIGIFGRTNVGKSSLLNLISGQETALVSPVPGTTTDAVEKTMELLPVGPVVFIDTAGIDDKSELGYLRVKNTKKILEKTDAVLLVCEAGVFSDYEESLVKEFEDRNIPFLIVFNKEDLLKDKKGFEKNFSIRGKEFIFSNARDVAKRDETVNKIKDFLLKVKGGKKEKPILSHLLPKGGLTVFIIPIDKEAPKGRIILPQVMAIRDLLDVDADSLCITEKKWPDVLKKLSVKPDLVVCDSQVANLMVEKAPADIKCTTFSIIFSAFKGEIKDFARAAAAVNKLKPGDKVGILEACSHHPIEDDIGRIKLPKWLEKKAGGKLEIDVFAGRKMPENLENYNLLINCGGCMLTGLEMINRQKKAAEMSLPLTNYGMAIGACFGVLERLLEPFPSALKAYKQNL